MDDHLVIAHIVALGHLDDAIQDHGVAEEFGFDKLQMLILCLFIRKDTLDAHALAIIRMQFFCEPDTHKRSNPMDKRSNPVDKILHSQGHKLWFNGSLTV